MTRLNRSFCDAPHIYVRCRNGRAGFPTLTNYGGKRTDLSLPLAHLFVHERLKGRMPEAFNPHFSQRFLIDEADLVDRLWA
jgi:hypothetical protein